MVPSPTSPCTQSLATLHAKFLELLPRLRRHAEIVFRQVACPGQRDDLIAEVLALGWQWYRRLCQRGKNVAAFPAVFASLLGRAVKSGRRLTGQERARDVLSSVAQRRHGFRVEALPVATRTAQHELYGQYRGQQRLDAFEERLHHNTQTPVADQVVFRIDFPNWLKLRTARERRLIRAMAQNERTTELSKQFDLSPGRISQLRREFHQGWERYCGDMTENSEGHRQAALR